MLSRLAVWSGGRRSCASTRGHDGISTAVTAKGGRRIGAAYEVVDDCRHDLTAWVEFLKARVGPRVGLVGHSLGAVKCLYALAHEPALEAAYVITISPPRLSYSWFSSQPEGEAFLRTYRQAEALVQAGEPTATLEVAQPFPFVITAAGYVEKYGPDEHYHFLRYVNGVRCPVLITLGAVEVANNAAFRGSPEALAELRSPLLSVATIADADHFYSQARPALLEQIDRWLGGFAAVGRERRYSLSKVNFSIRLHEQANHRGTEKIQEAHQSWRWLGRSDVMKHVRRWLAPSTKCGVGSMHAIRSIICTTNCTRCGWVRGPARVQ